MDACKGNTVRRSILIHGKSFSDSFPNIRFGLVWGHLLLPGEVFAKICSFFGEKREKETNFRQTCANNDILAHLGGPLSSSKIFVNSKPLLVFKNSQNYRWNLDHRRMKTSWKTKKWQKIGEDWVHCLVAEADNAASNIFSLTFWEFTFMQMFY